MNAGSKIKCADSESESSGNNRTGGRTEGLCSRERFLGACNCQPVDYPPAWMMRQAGRALPEYRQLKEKYSFLELVRTPELAAEVTLQPIRRFSFDAAIIFSDILVVPEAMGQPYYFYNGGGVRMEFAIQTANDIEKLNVEDAAQKLAYVYDAIKLVRKSLGSKTALLGFSGSPWTLANFMLEGGSAERFEKAKLLFKKERVLFEKLMEKLCYVISEYLLMQIQAGADAVQIFDTLGGLLAPDEYIPASGKWIRLIITQLNRAVPVIVFSKDVHNNWKDIIGLGAQVIGIDSGVSLETARAVIPENIAIQGNLDPQLLRLPSSEPAIEATKRMLQVIKDRAGYIFNLGHGVPPDARLENIEAVLQTLRS